MTMPVQKDLSCYGWLSEDAKEVFYEAVDPEPVEEPEPEDNEEPAPMEE